MAEEHRFTAYCEKLFEWIAATVKEEIPPAAQAPQPEVLLMNAPANNHMLGIRILTLWLRNRGVPARVIDMPPTLEELAQMMIRTRPKSLLISIALAEQSADVAAIAQRIAQLPAPTRPRVIVGGYAVKLGLIAEIPGAELMGDISEL